MTWVLSKPLQPGRLFCVVGTTLQKPFSPCHFEGDGPNNLFHRLGLLRMVQQ